MIDTHAHLNDPKFADDLSDVLARAKNAGVERIIVCGYDLPSSHAAVEMAERYECIYASVGIHPHDASNFNNDTLAELKELSRHRRVIAIGETGLDFHYNFSPRKAQFEAFRAQVILAGEQSLPLIVHSRESNIETFKELCETTANIYGCVFHCFSGDEEFARKVLSMGFYIGVGGPITYKNSEKLRRVVEICPPDRLLVETDCPYLAPVPYRGKRNEPAYVRYVLEEAARLKGITFGELEKITTTNAHSLFARMDKGD